MVSLQMLAEAAYIVENTLSIHQSHKILDIHIVGTIKFITMYYYW